MKTTPMLFEELRERERELAAIKEEISLLEIQIAEQTTMDETILVYPENMKMLWVTEYRGRRYYSRSYIDAAAIAEKIRFPEEGNYEPVCEDPSASEDAGGKEESGRDHERLHERADSDPEKIQEEP